MADWSSIWAGFGILWISLAVYVAVILLRLRRASRNER